MVKIFVGNLTPNIASESLRSKFEEYGQVNECDVVSNYAFVHMEHDNEAKAAIAALNNLDMGGTRINVEISHGKKKSGDGGPMRGSWRGGGGYGGDFGGGRGGRGRGFGAPRGGPRGGGGGHFAPPPGEWGDSYGGGYGAPRGRGGYGAPPFPGRGAPRGGPSSRGAPRGAPRGGASAPRGRGAPRGGPPAFGGGRGAPRGGGYGAPAPDYSYNGGYGVEPVVDEYYGNGAAAPDYYGAPAVDYANGGAYAAGYDAYGGEYGAAEGYDAQSFYQDYSGYDYAQDYTGGATAPGRYAPYGRPPSRGRGR